MKDSRHASALFALAVCLAIFGQGLLTSAWRQANEAPKQCAPKTIDDGMRAGPEAQAPCDDTPDTPIFINSAP